MASVVCKSRPAKTNVIGWNWISDGFEFLLNCLLCEAGIEPAWNQTDIHPLMTFRFDCPPFGELLLAIRVMYPSCFHGRDWLHKREDGCPRGANLSGGLP